MSCIVRFPRDTTTERSFARDRASVVTAAVLQIVRGALLGWLDERDSAALAAARGEIETLLRDELADVARTTLSEIRLEDG